MLLLGCMRTIYLQVLRYLATNKQAQSHPAMDAEWAKPHVTYTLKDPGGSSSLTLTIRT